MAGDDLPVGHAERAGGTHVVELAIAQKFSTHIVGQAHPAEQAQQHQQQRNAGREHGAEDDEQVQLGHGPPDLNEALKRQIGFATKKTLNGTRNHAQHDAGEGQCQREQHAHAKAVDQLGQQVTPAVIRTQPIGAAGRCRVGCGGKVVQRLGAIGVRRKQRPVARLGQPLLNKRVQVVGGRGEVSAKGGLGVVTHHGPVGLALVDHHQRAVIGHQLRRQAYEHQHAKNQQAGKAQAVAPKAQPGAAAGALAVGRFVD